MATDDVTLDCRRCCCSFLLPLLSLLLTLVSTLMLLLLLVLSATRAVCRVPIAPALLTPHSQEPHQIMKLRIVMLLKCRSSKPTSVMINKSRLASTE